MLQGPREYRSFPEAHAALAGRLDRARQPVLFDRLDWMELLHERCFADAAVRIMHMREDNIDLWLFLLETGPRRLSALANWYSFSWNPVFCEPAAPNKQAGMLESVARALMSDVAHIDLYPLVEGEAATLVLHAFRRAGWFAVQRPMGGNYILPLNGRDFAGYWKQRPGRLRNQVRRKSRGSPFDIAIETGLTEASWRDFSTVHQLSWKDPDNQMDFFRALAERECAAGTLRLGFARLDGRPVATQFWTVENGVALIHKLSHDRALDAASPGTLLSHAMFRHAIDVDGVTLIDYGTGDNPYKAEWMDERRPLYRLDGFNPRFASAWLPAARTAISKLVG